MVARSIVVFGIAANLVLSLVLNCGAVGSGIPEVASSNDLIITAHDSLLELYVDGIPQQIPNGDIWSVTDYIPVSPISRLIAVSAFNMEYPSCAGIIAYIYPNYFITSSEWKCTESGSTGWFDLGFDDSSWPNAVEYGDNSNGHSTCTNGALKVGDVSPYAKWIWGDDPQFQIIIYCRGYIEVQSTVDTTAAFTTELDTSATSEALSTNTPVILPNDTLVITAYQSLEEVYVDGIRQTIFNGDDRYMPDYINVSSNSRLVAVHAMNLGNPTCAGIIASIHPDVLLTSKTWKCLYFAIEQWFALGFDDSVWQDAVEYGDNANGHSACTDLLKVQEISPDAKWIWGNDAAMQFAIYCRGYTSYCETSSPCMNNGTCLQNNQSVCECLPQFTGEFCETEVQTTIDTTAAFTTEQLDTTTLDISTVGETTSDASSIYTSIFTSDVQPTTEDIPPKDGLVVTAYQTLNELYVDGIIQTIVNGDTWSVPDYINVSSNTRLVAVSAINLGTISCAGILASIHPDFLLTDSKWKCIDAGIVDWFNLGFDDSIWPNATEYGDNSNGHSTCTNGPLRVVGISPNAKWIWGSNPIVEMTMFCRGYTAYCEISSPCLNGGTCLQNGQSVCECLPPYTGEFCETVVTLNDTLVVTAYQHLNELYVDGISQTIVNGDTWSVPDYINVSSITRLVAVAAINVGTTSCAGILASILPDYLLTNGQWKCIQSGGTDWFTLGFDDSNWPNAVEYGDNSNGHLTCTDGAMKVVDISPNAKWIWGSNPTQEFVMYCRGYTDYCERSSPCMNGGTCLQNDQTVCHCLPLYTGEFCETTLVTTNALVITAYEVLRHVYVDDVNQTIFFGGIWSVPKSLPIASNTRLVAVYASNDNWPYCAGILASAESDFILTGRRWKCSISQPEDWFRLGFDDSDWEYADVYGDNSNGHFCNSAMKVEEISPDASWIWGSDLQHYAAYCRGYTTYCETSSPCMNGGTCLQNNQKVCQCLHPFTGDFCETELQVLVITAKSMLYELFIDGRPMDVSHGNDVSLPDQVAVPTHSRLIAVTAIDTTATCAGILASISNDYFLSDATWKCVADISPMWYTLGFDDSSWSNAYVIGPNGNVTTPEPCQILEGIPSISPKASWIWTPSIANAPHYQDSISCRAYLPTCDDESICKNGGTCNRNDDTFCSCLPGYIGTYCEIDHRRTLSITAKWDIQQLYIDGNEIAVPNGNNWTLADDISLSATNRLIAVLATDFTETCAGLIASVTDDYLVTDATWKCDIGAPPDWFLLGFDDSNWPNAYVIGPNGDVTWPEPCEVLVEIPDISPNASWIWTPTIPETPFYEQIIYCRTYLPLCKQGIVCQNGGTCLENSANICICAAGFSGVYCELEMSTLEHK